MPGILSQTVPVNQKMTAIKNGGALHVPTGNFQDKGKRIEEEWEERSSLKDGYQNYKNVEY